ncbi:transposase, MuDR [Artemisia annua]|uniref:Transposase, MuDR n=1 Tax=Artemisia annua TaxID=35608 RepID=A0A2U1KJG5_ARTAN|nr:transposase, MuDR [Artemisia annua]
MNHGHFKLEIETKKNASFNPYVKYKNEPNLFTLKVNHGGHFTYFPGPKRTRAPRRVYKGGDADWFDDVDADGFSVIEVTGMLKELGYVNPKMKVYFKRPTHDLDKGLEPLFKDVDVLDMISYVNKFKLMESSETRHRPSPIEDEFDPLFSYPATNNDMPKSSEPIHSPNETSDVREGIDRSDSNVESEGSDRSESNDESEEESEVSDFECDLEDQINDVEVDMEFFRKNTDPSVEWVDDDEAERKKALRKLGKSHKLVDGKLYTENFDVSQTFANKELIKEMVTRIAVEQRRQIYLTRNDKGRTKQKGLKAVGEELKCPWLLHCSKPKGEGTWFKINPCAGQDMWPPSDSPITITPPDYHTPIGRPPKKRKKSAAELFDNMVKNGKLSRAGKTITCKKCKQKGHNSRSCTGRPTQSQSSQRPSQSSQRPSQTGQRPSQTGQRTSKQKKTPTAPVHSSQRPPQSQSTPCQSAPSQVAPIQSTPSQVASIISSAPASRLSPLKGSNSNLKESCGLMFAYCKVFAEYVECLQTNPFDMLKVNKYWNYIKEHCIHLKLHQFLGKHKRPTTDIIKDIHQLHLTRKYNTKTSQVHPNMIFILLASPWYLATLACKPFMFLKRPGII